MAGEDALLHVKDDGPGVPLELQERIFAPYFTTREDGTGTGLALARRVARRAGGEVSLSSPPGEGARITVRLPLADAR